MNNSEQYLPYQSRFVEIDGHSMHYIDEGEGPVVVLLHGNPTWCYYYRNLIKALSPHFRAIAPDMIGCGLSDKPSDRSFTAAERMDHIAAFIDKLGLDSFSMVLHDWGGPIGTGAAIKKIDKLEKIVYLNTTLTEIEALPTVIKASAAFGVGAAITQYTSSFIKLTTDWGVHKKLAPEVRAGYFFPYKTAASRKAVREFVADIPFSSSHPSYGTLQDLAKNLKLLKPKPVQILWGLQDICFNKRILDRVASHFPDAEVHEFTDASHLILEDKPEECASLILQFLKGTQEKKKRGQQPKDGSEPVSYLASSFLHYAESHGGQQALTVAKPRFNGRLLYQRYNYRQMLELSGKYQRGLESLGLTSGDRVLFLVPVGEEFLAFVCAVMAIGAIPVFVDPGVGKKNLVRAISDAKPDAYISVPKGHLLKHLCGNAFDRCRFHVTVGGLRLPGSHTHSAVLRRFASGPLILRPSTGVSFVAYTSGATGTPKGVVYTEEMLEHLDRVLSNELHIPPGSIDMPLLPIFSIFNIARGVTSALAPINAAKPLELNPELVANTVNDLGVISSFGSPTLWAKIGDYCVRNGVKLPSLTRILIAGAPVSQNVVDTLEQVLPLDSVFTPYGATEVLPVTAPSCRYRQDTPKVSARSGEQGVLVGMPIRGISVRVVSMQDGPIKSEDLLADCAPREIGEVLVQGGHVSPSYLHRPDAVEKGKVPSADGLFWHRMGDTGYLDDEGNLYFTGRCAHSIRAHDKQYYSVPVELIFNQHKKVYRSALISLAGGNGIGVAIEPYPEYFPSTPLDEQTFRDELLECAKSDSVTALLVDFFFFKAFPVDGRHNAKIFRCKLGVKASEIQKEQLLSSGNS